MQLHDIINFFVFSPYLNEDFLRQKYLKEGLSTTKIAKEIGSASSTVLKYLKEFGIPIREPSKRVSGRRKGYGLPYGKRIVNNKMVDFKKEIENIKKMKAMRMKGYSYRKIAEIFNTLEIPTQTQKGQWHGKTIQQILEKIKKI